MVFAVMSMAMIAGAGNSSFAPAKEKLTANLHEVTYNVSDCL